MNKIQPNIKIRAVFFVLILLSIISTFHIIFHYHTDVLMKDTVAIFNVPDSVVLKEVGIVDFVVEVFKRVVVAII
ncbi:MAG TPA: hypothetical protein VKZ56_06210 [Membranihabitans sp.]|nr:hypothetical protein [Membranihabitans sp.]